MRRHKIFSKKKNVNIKDSSSEEDNNGADNNEEEVIIEEYNNNLVITNPIRDDNIEIKKVLDESKHDSDLDTSESEVSNKSSEKSSNVVSKKHKINTIQTSSDNDSNSSDQDTTTTSILKKKNLIDTTTKFKLYLNYLLKIINDIKNLSDIDQICVLSMKLKKDIEMIDNIDERVIRPTNCHIELKNMINKLLTKLKLGVDKDTGILITEIIN